ncbi:hypothetical protein [Leptospira kirschneri]|uniref:hypothetical protein n=1 Tax=Leptospira kirschneri TaxID=29507 RepID=UPI0002BE4CA3|nr:hypothetical protein [Leptospira kirschneri]EMK18817.1 hypothetical protein LEP1GSC042_3937 [Leptospira kirschneri serovar Bim str. PUO 1247]EMN03514.1 hypothetical protein LEP1GSC046_0764 [Leptospira kirschneri serovar Bim str. 1051]EPG49476.1 hypothetical protein LEP1GSC049_0251 [Leptospira kirschneri serovar Cynopteri str. 3522 CT]
MIEIDPNTEDLFPVLWDVELLKNDFSKCSLLEEIIRLADLRKNKELGFEVRLALIEAGIFSGAIDKALISFSWCLSQVDQNPEKFSEEDLLWKYKWIIENLPAFPQIKKEQILEMLEDLEKRYEKNGENKHPVLMLKRSISMSMRNIEESQKYHELLKQTTAKGRLADCAACVQNSEVFYAVHLGQDEVALEKAKSILSGKLRCAEVPHLTYGTLLLPLLRLNQPEEAARLHKIGYRLVSNSTALLGTISEHLLFLGITGEIAKAIQLLEKHFAFAFRAPDLNYRFQFYKAAKFLTERILLSNLKSIKIRMPKTFPDYKENGNYAVIDLDSWFGKEASRLASQFDSRNGNDSYMEDLKGLKAFHELSQKHLQENNQ